ncbi:MAG TPA: methyltransferase [Candidatus Dormibacteraeota bacterium]|nr:methyltransferase [Candidatus Dormibacteraeota bacterium]
MSRIIRAYRQSSCVAVAVELGLAERLAAGPRSAAELAAEAGAHTPSLRRLLRTLVAMGVVAEDGSGRYSVTPLGEEMRQDRLGPTARFFNAEHHLQSWMHLDHSIRTGERAFDHVYGMRNWDYYAKHPTEAAIFDGAMSSITGPVSKAVAAAYDFSQFPLIADLGGGDGTLLTEILHRYPSVRGLLFDLPNVVERARKKLAASNVMDRCELVCGSFLEKIPAGASLYMMKTIIHDWEEPAVGTILERCRAAVGDSGAPLLLIERVLPERIGPEDMDDLLADLDMLANPGGQERTESEYTGLLERAGFRLERIFPTPTPFKIVESHPV